MFAKPYKIRAESTTEYKIQLRRENGGSNQVKVLGTVLCKKRSMEDESSKGQIDALEKYERNKHEYLGKGYKKWCYPPNSNKGMTCI